MQQFKLLEKKTDNENLPLHTSNFHKNKLNHQYSSGEPCRDRPLLEVVGEVVGDVLGDGVGLGRVGQNAELVPAAGAHVLDCKKIIYI